MSLAELLSPGTRLPSAPSQTTYRPSALMEALPDPLVFWLPSEATLTR